MNIKIKNIFKNKNENERIIYLNVILSLIIKGAALLISLFTMPIYIKYFNNEKVLGLWFTILSLVNWIFAFDLGIGNGLRNKLTISFTNKNQSQSKKYISSAYFTIGIISLILIAFFLIVSNFLDWNKILNIDTSIISKNTLTIAIKILFTGMIVQFFLKIITSILYAIQKPFITNLLSLVISLGTLIAVALIPSSDNSTNLINMSIISVIFNIIPYLLCTIMLFLNKNFKPMKPSLKYIRKLESKEILLIGGNFFYIQILYMIIIATNEILITNLFDASYVVEYQIYYRLFSLIGTAFTLMLTPIWSVVTKALAEKDYIWIKKLFKKLLAMSGCAIAVEFLMIPILQPIVNFWLKENAIIVDYKISIIFAILGSLMIFNGTLSSIANGMNKLKIQTIFYTIGVILKVMICLFMIKHSKNWAIPVIATDIVLFIYCIIQYISNNNEINKKIEERKK